MMPDDLHPPPERKPGIGTLSETSLHAALKGWYTRPGDRVEAKVDGYVIDLVRGDLLIEIQTRNFSAIRPKLVRLLDSHPIRLIYPISVEKWIIKQHSSGPTRRKSPRRGRIEQVFMEMVRIPDLVSHPNFSLEVVLIREEEIQAPSPRASWRRKGWGIADRRLVEVTGSTTFECPGDFRALLPETLPAQFTTRDLAGALGQPRYVAQKMAYCLRNMHVILPAGKRGRSYLYEVNP